MRGKNLISLFFVVLGLLDARQASLAISVDTQLNSYTIFDVKQLSFGKNVTVGKYVLAYLPLGEKITIQAANPPQSLDVRLKWLNRKSDHQKLKILGEWSQNDHRLTIGVNFGRKLHASKASLKQEGEKGVILVKGNLPNLISIPLMADHPIMIFADKKKFGAFAHKVRIIASSNKAFQIER
ncbi:MAG: hypothetical protein AB8G05_19005 [Oligoflexales bacterium]